MLARIILSARVCLGDAGGDILALLLRRHTAGFFRHLTKMLSFSKYANVFLSWLSFDIF